MTPERKGVHVITADIKSAKAEDGTYDITLSVPTQDRDGEVVDAKAFDPLPEGRMPVDVDHGMTVLTTVASGVPEYDGDALKLRDFRFASTALGQDVRALVDEGHISKMSVAFMDALREQDDKDGLMHVRKAELLNAAVVAIPSNREADIAFAAKSALAAFQKVGACNSSKDSELIQTMHDSATALGAVCAGVTKSALTIGSTSNATQGVIKSNVGAVYSPPLPNYGPNPLTLPNYGLNPLTSTATSTWTMDAPDPKSANETAPTACPACGQQIPAATDPEETAAVEPAAVTPPADVLLAQAQASIASAELTLLP